MACYISVIMACYILVMMACYISVVTACYKLVITACYILVIMACYILVIPSSCSVDSSVQLVSGPRFLDSSSSYIDRPQTGLHASMHACLYAGSKDARLPSNQGRDRPMRLRVLSPADVCTHAHKHVYAHICAHACTHVYAHVCAHFYTQVDAHAHT